MFLMYKTLFSYFKLVACLFAGFNVLIKYCFVINQMTIFLLFSSL